VHLHANAAQFLQPDDMVFDSLQDRATINVILAEVVCKIIAKSDIDENVCGSNFAKIEKALR
jgi:hypothetical protein